MEAPSPARRGLNFAEDLILGSSPRMTLRMAASRDDLRVTPCHSRGGERGDTMEQRGERGWFFPVLAAAISLTL